MTAFEKQIEPQLVLNVLESSETRRFIYMEVIKRIVQEIVHFESLQPLLAYVVTALQEQLDFYIASVFVYDTEKHIATLVAQDGQSDIPVPIGYTQSICDGLLGKTLSEGKTMLIDDVSQVEGYVSPQGYSPAKSELCVPIYANNILWGAFNVESIEKAAFSYYDRLALEVIANQLGSAIYNLELRDQQKHMLDDLSLYAQQVVHSLDQIQQLSTPVFPVYPGILALPLIGMLDSERMKHTFTTLLNTIQQTGSNHVILDVTGIAMPDQSIGQSLVHLVRASKLLGAEVIMTGMRPDMASALVQIQTNLREVTVCHNFAAGLQHALKRCGKNIIAQSSYQQKIPSLVA